MITKPLQKNIPKGWSIKKIKDLLDYERPDKYIVESPIYSPNAKTPVLTANKSFVLGYTDEKDGIYSDTPVIIFDDFTTDSKYVEFPFKVKSSAIKILKNIDSSAELKFIYEIMKSFNFPIANHKRHYISQYQELDIVIPSLAEQKKIADILRDVDIEIEKVEESIILAEKLKQGLFKDLFKNKNQVLLDSVAKRGSGHTPNKKHPEYWNGGIKWVSLSDSSKLDTRYITQTDKEISLEGIENSSAVLHPKDTVIVCRDAGIGKVAILGLDNMAVSQHFIAWKCGEDLYNRYLYYWLQSKKKDLEKIATGTTIKTIGLQFFKDLKIPLPELNLQRKFADSIWAIDEKITISKRLKESLIKLKKGLVSDLLSGKVRTI